MRHKVHQIQRDHIRSDMIALNNDNDNNNDNNDDNYNEVYDFSGLDENLSSLMDDNNDNNDNNDNESRNQKSKLFYSQSNSVET